MRSLALVTAVLALAPAAARAERVSNVPNPRDRGSWVSDMAGVISEIDERTIDARLDKLEGHNGAQVALVTVRKVDDYDPKRFTTELFNRWGIGAKGADNGVLVVFSLGDRRIEIETGYGAEGVLTDGEAGEILRRHAVPAFKAQEYSTGLRDTMFSIAAQMEESEPAFSRVTRSVGLSPSGAMAGLGLLFALAVVVFLWRWSRRPPRCSRCGEPMRELSPSQEKAYLNEDRAFEEEIGSVNHVVYRCDEDREMTIKERNKLFSGYHDCSVCVNRTAVRSVTTLRYATYDYGGEERVTQQCKLPRCRHRHSYTRSTPRKTRPSSSTSSSSSSWSSSSSGWSSGGSSSFGGGSSGGGGAGASW
jgi:uncharacterized protein